MSTGRVHPINNLLEFGVADTAGVLLGFSWPAVEVLLTFNLIYSSMVHANLGWTFGPLRYLLASPVFHRWHHTTEDAGQSKNFASRLSLSPGRCLRHLPHAGGKNCRAASARAILISRKASGASSSTRSARRGLPSPA